MLTFQYAKNPIWNSNDEQQIFLMVKFEEFNEELPFTATSFDSEPWGVEIYNRAKAGEFGEIAPWVDPMVGTLEQPQTTGSQTL